MENFESSKKDWNDGQFPGEVDENILQARQGWEKDKEVARPLEPKKENIESLLSIHNAGEELPEDLNDSESLLVTGDEEEEDVETGPLHDIVIPLDDTGSEGEDTLRKAA